MCDTDGKPTYDRNHVWGTGGYNPPVPRFKEQAICVRHLDWSETSQIVMLLTEHRGTLRCVAKGSKRLSPGAIQRYSGGIELLTLGQAVGNTKASAELANLTEWDLQQPWPHLREYLASHRLGCYAADLCHAFIQPDDAHPNVFHAALNFLEGLSEPTHHAAELLRFQWVLLTDVGYRPELDADVLTGEELHKARVFGFDPQRGGLTRDVGEGFGRWRVRPATVYLLRNLDELLGDEGGDIADVIAAAEPSDIERANKLLASYLRSVLDKELPTMKYVMGNGQ